MAIEFSGDAVAAAIQKSHHDTALIHQVRAIQVAGKDEQTPDWYSKKLSDTNTEKTLPDIGVDYTGFKGKLTGDEIKNSVRELNHETNGMVEPGKETTSLRQANEALLNGDMKKFASAFKDLTAEERKNVAEAMNLAFQKKCDDTRVSVDVDGNIIVSHSDGKNETAAVKIYADTGKVTEVHGKRDGNDFIVAGESTRSNPESLFKDLGDDAARVMNPGIPLRWSQPE